MSGARAGDGAAVAPRTAGSAPPPGARPPPSEARLPAGGRPSAPAEPFVAAGFEGLERAFYGQLERGLHRGAQLRVLLDGVPVAELWGGHADRGRRYRITRSTSFAVFSATKALTAACVHLLADRGRLELEAPVAAYWPAFAARGKSALTVADLLLHRAGIPGKADLPEVLSWLLPGGGARRAARARPDPRLLGRTVYHPFSAGFVLGRLVEILDGRSAADYLREEFLEPLGMADSSPGLPLRVPRPSSAASGIHTEDPAQAGAARLFSLRPWRAAYLPAGSLNTCAADLSRFYEMLRRGGELEGRRCLSEEAVARATALRYDGPDGDTGRRIRWALGFGLGGYSTFPDRDIRHMGRGGSERSFGHSGQGGSAFGWADPPSGLVFAFCCNGLLPMEEAWLRFEELADACWTALGR